MCSTHRRRPVLWVRKRRISTIQWHNIYTHRVYKYHFIIIIILSSFVFVCGMSAVGTQCAPKNAINSNKSYSWIVLFDVNYTTSVWYILFYWLIHINYIIAWRISNCGFFLFICLSSLRQRRHYRPRRMRTLAALSNVHDMLLFTHNYW